MDFVDRRDPERLFVERIDPDLDKTGSYEQAIDMVLEHEEVDAVGDPDSVALSSTSLNGN